MKSMNIGVVILIEKSEEKNVSNKQKQMHIARFIVDKKSAFIFDY